jgi:hypothetical protein
MSKSGTVEEYTLLEVGEKDRDPVYPIASLETLIAMPLVKASF